MGSITSVENGDVAVTGMNSQNNTQFVPQWPDDDNTFLFPKPLKLNHKVSINGLFQKDVQNGSLIIEFLDDRQKVASYEIKIIDGKIFINEEEVEDIKSEFELEISFADYSTIDITFCGGVPKNVYSNENIENLRSFRILGDVNKIKSLYFKFE